MSARGTDLPDLKKTPKMVRFCILCGEREDSPYRSQWCDDYSYTEQPRGTHVWGNPQEVKA